MNYRLYICASDAEGGLYQYILDEKGKLSKGEITPLDTPMYSIFSGDKIYVILNECFPEGFGGLLSFDIDEKGNLSNRSETVSTLGKVPCHLTEADGKIYCVCYVSGSVFMTPDKSVVHTGSGPNLPRQSAAHTHFVTETPDKKYIAVTDLGTDQIYFYSKDLTPEHTLKTPEGSGVRHLVFSKDGRYMYAVTELYSTVLVYSYGKNREDISLLGSYNALPEDFTQKNTAAAIRLDEDYLYVSNRGHNSLVRFKISGDVLENREFFTCGGDGPRDFDIFGDYIVVTNEKSNNITVINKKTGEITDNTAAPSPIAVIGKAI